ncbi:MAG: cohesin domain-containing protein [Christensenella sp.]|nr:cohesin domain-containing protein [Christensenella sp.]
MKRVFLFLTVLLLAVSLTAPKRALAEETDSVLISIGTVTGETDGQVDLPVALSQCKGVDSVQFDLNYDSAALKFISMTPGDLFAAQYTVVNADVPGRIRVACASALGLENEGTLLTLRFQVLSGTGSAVTISSGIVTRVDADYNQSTALVSIADGGIAVGTAPLPTPAVTPWVPATPVPTPSPTPEATATATPSPTQAPNLASPEIVAPPAARLTASAYYVGGGLLLAVVALSVLVLAKKNRNN